MKVCELFAGVGGFRYGLERYSDEFETVFFNQWEPSYKSQFAYECYIKHYPLDTIAEDLRPYTNLDIHQVPKDKLPDFDLLVGGFPCQNYSVAGPKSSKGIEGTKGILWWDIRSTLEAKSPSYVLLENVDRLLKSPASQRGRDFGVILKCFDELDYDVQWRVINAADYGKPQKRRRTFIFAYKNHLRYAGENPDFFGSIFPCTYEEKTCKQATVRDLDISQISESFAFTFETSGHMADGIITTKKAAAVKADNDRTLGSVLVPAPDDSYNIKNEAPWIEAKQSKKKERTTKEGFTYIFSEGTCPYPDNEAVPARTMLTSEGSVNRSSHVVLDPATGQKRILLPLEAERIQTFPDDWTRHGIQMLEDGNMAETTLSNRQRYFLMGNALVTELVTDMAPEILRLYHDTRGKRSGVSCKHENAEQSVGIKGSNTF